MVGPKGTDKQDHMLVDDYELIYYGADFGTGKFSD